MDQANNLLKDLEDCVASGDIPKMERLIKAFTPVSQPPEKIMDALCRGMEKSRKSLAVKDRAVSDILLSIDCFNLGARELAGSDGAGNRANGASVVIGVVAGDVHHMGKNIVSAVLSANGFQVHDAGRDVPNHKFIDMVKETNAEILALSVMMSTPHNNMAELIRTVRYISPATRVIVGGASMDAELAGIIGADGYAEDAVTATEEFVRVLSLNN